MSKITFKRISLVVVTALGFGLMSTNPSSATITSSSDTMTLSSSTASIGTGETASVTIAVSGIAGAAGDSLIVNVATQSRANGAGDGSLGHYITDSSNARIRTAAYIPLGGTDQGNNLSGSRQYDDFDSAAAGVNVSAGMGSRKVADTSGGYVGAFVGATAATAFSASISLRFIAPTIAGTYVFRVYLGGTNAAGTAYTPVTSPLTWTVTVTANSSAVGSATYSKFWMNRTTEFTTSTGYASSTLGLAYNPLQADSTLVVSSGLPSTNTAHAVIIPLVHNSSDTKIAGISFPDGAVNNTRVKDSVTVVITGPGALSVSSYWYGLGNQIGGAALVKSKQVTMDWKESVVVYSDGSAGVATITAYVGGSATSNAAFAQGTKTITFVGRATTFTVTGGTAAIRAGSTIGLIKDNGDNDSDVAGSTAIRFKAYDSLGQEVTTAALSTDQGGSAFWAMSSDTSVLAASPRTQTSSAAVSAARRTPYLPCNYNVGSSSPWTSSVATTTNYGYWLCDGAVYDSGTVTLTIVDSRTVTPNGSNFTVNASGGVYRSAPFSLTYVGKGYEGTISLSGTAGGAAKSTFNTNEAAYITLTCKDASGRTVPDRHNTCFTNLNWVGLAPTFAVNESVQAAGGTFVNMKTWLDGTGTYTTSFVGGTDTAMVYMPSTYSGAGEFELKGRSAGDTADRTLLKFTVVDPLNTANVAAIAAAQAAADAATDAALEAIDAANAATDAANLAAEAADAATVAAEEARDAADAAASAVEALATEVATLMAALKAQLTTLARTVAKIAKKVKA